MFTCYIHSHWPRLSAVSTKVVNNQMHVRLQGAGSFLGASPGSGGRNSDQPSLLIFKRRSQTE